MSVANIPIKLKPLASYIKTANEIEKRDPVVSYYCRLYAVQRGMELDRSSQESKKYLMELMDQLDKIKKELKDNESIISETVGQAHVEEYALRLFSYADKNDREGNFEPGTIRSFITSGFLMDVLTVFGDVGEDIEKCRKYAKWKAVYISQCLKNGEVPHAGPLGEDESLPSTFNAGGNRDLPTEFKPQQPINQPSATNVNPTQPPMPTPRIVKPSASSGIPPANQATNSYYCDTTTETAKDKLTMQDYAQAEKLCKYASSALQYQDSTTAINYLTQCLELLNKGNNA